MINNIVDYVKEKKAENYEKIKDGLTNESYIVYYDNKREFVQFKNDKKFNHLINYENLKNMKFIPKLIENKKNYSVWEYLENNKKISRKKMIKKAAKIINKLHKSNLKIKDVDISKMIEHYKNQADKIHKNNKPIEIEKYYKKAIIETKKLDKKIAIHFDPWIKNFIFHKNKTYLIDFEYAGMGDRYWDIAYFIEGSLFTNDEKKYALKFFKNINYDKLERTKFIVNYITIVWLYSHKNYNMFPHQNIIENIIKTGDKI